MPARADQKNVKRSVRDGFRPEALDDRPDKANAKPDKKYASKSVDPAAETAVAAAKGLKTKDERDDTEP